jgi:hypothetical protein
MIVGAATGSQVMGYVAGGSLAGAMLGAALSNHQEAQAEPSGSHYEGSCTASDTASDWTGSDDSSGGGGGSYGDE